jgi:hypothetical protein
LTAIPGPVIEAAIIAHTEGKERDMGYGRLIGLLALAALAGAGCGSSGKGDDADAAGTDTWTDGGTDAGTDTGTDTDADTDSDGDTDGDTDSDGDTDADAGTDGDGGTDTGSGSDADTDSDTDTSADAIVPSIESCAPEGDPCDLGAADTGVYATYRKDAYLPQGTYNEPTTIPANGGRFHIAAIAAASGDVTAVRVDGELVEDLLTEPHMEWYHVWPRAAVAGEPIWVAFHSRDPAWDSAATGHVTVEYSDGNLVDADFDVQETPVPLTWVTVTDDFSSFVIHLKNTDTAAHTATRVLVNGRDVLGGDTACIPDATVGAGEAVMWTVPLCAPTEAGAAWTVVVEFADAPPSVGVGRVLRPHYPVEAWTNGDDCAFSGDDATYFDKHLAAGFDTNYMYRGGNGSCSYDPVAMINTVAPALSDFNVLIGDDFLAYPSPETTITEGSAVAGFLTGDESDGEVYVGGAPQAELKAADARTLWGMYPALTVYNGGKTNKNVGSFAGMADVQGMDFYVAACAPHITNWGTHPPLRGAYDYLRNARDNHMPLTTWFYAQGLHGGWNKSGALGTIHVQPDAQEILVQAMSVVAAGAKGIMWFQTDMAEATHAPKRWQAISDANWMIRGVRPLLREGDVTGRAMTSGQAIVDAIRSSRAIVVPIINLSVQKAPTDILCGAAFVSEATVPHWVLKDQTLDMVVDVPDDFAVRDVFEVTADSAKDLAFSYVVAGRAFTVSDVVLSNAVPVRLFVLAADADVRAEVQDRLAP